MVSEDMRYKILILKALWVSGHRWEVRLFKLLIIIKINFVLFNIGHWKCNKTPIFKWYGTWILTCIMFCKGQMVYLKKSLFTLLFRVIFNVGCSPRFTLSLQLHKRFPLTPTVRGGYIYQWTHKDVKRVTLMSLSNKLI